ncbi:hypothetical protein IFM89_035316 [Coptis chinensis]|uniref:U1-type domain-containing protein n=1 Tax=Coptis chinensis TaxID=261450 RepID=A0A835M346_9MAGN|nr:hypothetical protein IFM89_035316 [Coptis chinensis]
MKVCCGISMPYSYNWVLVPTSSSDSFFANNALRAGFIGGEVKRSEYMMNSDPSLREAIQREVEKERIREEIIAQEIIRRRELEAEVRRELAMERDLYLRRPEGYSFSSPSMWSDTRVMPSMLDRQSSGFGFAERLPYSGRTDVGLFAERLPYTVARTEVGSFERVPFQRSVEAAKMAESSTGQAGKLMVFVPSGAHNGSDSKLTLDRIMKLFNEHVEGKKHKSKEASLSRAATKSKSNSSPSAKITDLPVKVAKKNNSPTPKTLNNLKVKAKKVMNPEMKKKKFAFWCQDCQVGCHSEAVLNHHCSGKKHIAKMEELKQAGVTASSTTTAEDANHGKTGASLEAEEEGRLNIDRKGDEEVKAEEQEATEEGASEEAKGEGKVDMDRNGEEEVKPEEQEEKTMWSLVDGQKQSHERNEGANLTGEEMD